MTLTTRIEIVQHAVRWTSNILTEVLSNHGKCLSQEARHNLASAVQRLGDAEFNIRQMPAELPKEGS